MRGGYARAPSGGDLLAITQSLAVSPSPGAPQGPRAFCCLRRPAFRSRHSDERRDPNAPLAESAYARASEARFSGFESQVGYQILFARAKAPAALLQLGCGKTIPAARNVPSVGLWAARRGGGFSPAQRSRRLTVRTAALQAVYAGSNPAGNASGDVAQSIEQSPCKRKMRV